MNQALVFASTCPHCKCDQAQDGFSVEDLLRLLDGGYPIEGYCESCDEFWPISLRERVTLGEVVARFDGSHLPPEENDRLTQFQSD